MAGLLYAIVLMGCSDFGDECRTLAIGDALHASRAECMVGIDAALASQIALQADFPSVVAVCRAVPANPALARFALMARLGEGINAGDLR